MDDLKTTDNQPQGDMPQLSVAQVSPSVGDQTIPKPTPPEPAPTMPLTPESDLPKPTTPQVVTNQTTATTGASEEKSKLSGRFTKSPKKKIIAGIGVLLMVVLGGISVATAWKLRQVEKVSPEEAKAWVGDHCSGDCAITVGPGKYGFETVGMGTMGIQGPNVEKTVSVNIPVGTTVHSAYLFWSGEAYPPNENDINLVVNGTTINANPTFSWFNTRPQYPQKRYYQYANLAQIPQEAIQSTTGNITFKVKGFDPVQKNLDDGTFYVHNHGFGIVVVYTGPEVSNNKIILRLWGEWLYLACPPFDTRTECEGPRSKIMEMGLSDLDTTKPRENKFAFFFGEGEAYRGICQDGEGGMRPSHLYYKTTSNWIKLAANTGIPEHPWPACPLPVSSQPGGWWATRVTGVDLDSITLDASQISFSADSAYLADETPANGESYTFVGVVAQYPVAEPTPTPTPPPPPGCWETCTPGTCPSGLECQDQDGLRCVNPACPSEENCECPTLACLALTATTTELIEGDEVDFTCKGSSGVDNPVDHVEFRVQIDGGSWSSLGTAPGTKTDGEYEGTISYTVPQTGSYRVECRVCTSADTSACTTWGLAE
jgi:hypothetical protein